MSNQIALAAWFDLSPMRPDEWADTDIGRWTEAMEIRLAYQEGVEDANQELKADKAAKAAIEKMKNR